MTKEEIEQEKMDKKTIALFKSVLRYLKVSSDDYSEETFCENFERYSRYIDKACEYAYGTRRPACINKLINGSLPVHREAYKMYNRKCKGN